MVLKKTRSQELIEGRECLKITGEPGFTVNMLAGYFNWPKRNRRKYEGPQRTHNRTPLEKWELIKKGCHLLNPPPVNRRNLVT